MKTMIQVSMVALAVCLLMVGDISARGGRGGGGGGGGARGGGGGGGARVGGGGGGGGMSRPSPSISRSPSVSRPSMPASRPTAGPRPGTGGLSNAGNRPSTGLPNAGNRPGGAVNRPNPGARPSTGDLNNFLDMPRPSTGAIGSGPGSRPGGSNLGAATGAIAGGGAAAAFLQGQGVAGRPAAGQLPAIGDRPGAGRIEGAADRRGDLAANRPGRIDNRQEWQQNRGDRRDEVRDQVRENNPRLDFWSDYPNWAAWRINRPYRWATWGAITGWVGYGWSDATTYSYGDNVYYQDDSVYYGDQVVASTEEYAQQAEQIVASAPEVAPEDAEWMPLGVFAVTPDGEGSGPAPSLFVQLAISKEGVINGTLNDSATNSTQPIEGLADKESQRSAWTVAGKSRPIMETGISNLTQDTVPVLVHFADGQTQQMLLVRLEDPQGQP